MVETVVGPCGSDLVGLFPVSSALCPFHFLEEGLVRAELFDERLVQEELDVFLEVVGTIRRRALPRLLSVFRFARVNPFQNAQPAEISQSELNTILKINQQECPNKFVLQFCIIITFVLKQGKYPN